MAALAPQRVIPFREVRNNQPEDCVHYESIEFRGRMYEWLLPAHCHEALYQFTYLQRGAVVATIDGTRYALKAPTAWMVTPGVMHAFAYQSDSAGERVSVPAAVLHSALTPQADLGRHLSQVVVADKATAGSEIDELRDLFSKIGQEFQGARVGRTEALRANAALLALWFVRCEGAGPSASSSRLKRDVLVERYRVLIDANFRKHWPVRDYAAALNVTADHLSRRCRAVTGLSALHLVQERSLLEARRMLAYSDTTISDIARQLGFEDPGYFSRVFAKHAGQSPLAYRVTVAAG